MHCTPVCIAIPCENAIHHIGFSTLPSFCKRECKTRAMSDARSAMQKVLMLWAFLALAGDRRAAAGARRFGSFLYARTSANGDRGWRAQDETPGPLGSDSAQQQLSEPPRSTPQHVKRYDLRGSCELNCRAARHAQPQCELRAPISARVPTCDCGPGAFPRLARAMRALHTAEAARPCEALRAVAIAPGRERCGAYSRI
jgi:hypothetical protein